MKILVIIASLAISAWAYGQSKPSCPMHKAQGSSDAHSAVSILVAIKRWDSRMQSLRITFDCFQMAVRSKLAQRNRMTL